MASYTYRVYIAFIGGNAVSRNERSSAEEAIALARAQHWLSDGTRIAITRRRLTWHWLSVRGSASLVKRRVPTGPELAYRTYVVEGGIVRRTDR